MIPRRVKLSGFLSYKDEQEIAFDDASLWMLAGLNGSGKSSVFDALTYSLFGVHRGGSMNAGELVNKESKSMSVEFEFALDGQAYRIQRTLRRDAKGNTKGTQNIYREVAAGRWAAEEDTNLADGFKAWIREKIGLNYDTFTSSVLLLQGRAEKLLDSKPSGRAEVLAGIVDLERFQKLHEKADVRRKGAKATVEALEAQATGVPVVSDFELFSAETKVIAAEDAKEAAAKEAERTQSLEFDARRWADLTTRQSALDDRWRTGEALMREAAEIEKSFRRMTELREVIPHVLTVQEKQRALADSERASTQLATLKQQTEAGRGEIERILELARKTKSSHQQMLMKAEEALAAAQAALRDLAGPLSHLAMYEQHAARLSRCEVDLKALPAKAVEESQRAQEAYDAVEALGRSVPLWDRFAATRSAFAEATSRQAATATAMTGAMADGQRAKDAYTAAKEKLDAAAEARKAADAGETSARTLLQQARTAAEEFQSLEKAKQCRACGQPLTPAHWELEFAKRDRDKKTAGVNHKQATLAQQVAAKAEEEARKGHDAAERELVALRDQYRDLKKDSEAATGDVTRSTEAVRQAYFALPEAERSRVAAAPPADWRQTTYPTADDLRQLHTKAADRDAAKAKLAAAQATATKFERARAERDAAKATLDELKKQLGKADPTTLRDRQVKHQAEESALTLEVKANRKRIDETDRDIEAAQRKQADAEKALSEIQSQLRVESEKRVQQQDAIDRATKLVPEAWRSKLASAGLAEQNKWKDELNTLDGQGTAAKHEELQSARSSLETMKREIAAVAAEKEGVAEEARRPVAELKALLAEARKAIAARDEELQTAREEKAVLDRHRADLGKLRTQILEAEKDLAASTNLAQLLGRDRLQRHLVRTAERQIVECANGILDRLSGGQLFLRLAGSDDGAGPDRALDLEASNRSTGNSPINVAFLSGSQKFRVAVSLALGIGQYASRQHRPLESVIIDEGFGCLDRNGRQVMIQELHNLKDHMKCILLVSHQEEFADAFAHGYHFELENGATKVTRMTR